MLEIVNDKAKKKVNDFQYTELKPTSGRTALFLIVTPAKLCVPCIPVSQLAKCVNHVCFSVKEKNRGKENRLMGCVGVSIW